MTDCRLELIPYHRSLMRPIRTAHGVYEARSGIVFALHAPDGRIGLGDAAPLPGLSLETVDDVARQAGDLRAQIEQVAPEYLNTLSIDEFTAAAARLFGRYDPFPSIRFAAETALADLAAQSCGATLAHWLSDQAGASVAVNGLIDDLDPAAAASRSRMLTDAGFDTIKIKVGVADVGHDIERIGAVRQASPHAAIRIDANGAWNESQLRSVLAGSRDYNLEFVEQPLPPGCAENSRRICSESGVRLALDEEAAGIELARYILKAEMCDVLVIKPMLIGGLTDCIRLCDLAIRHKIDVVYTTVWESDIGVAATLHLAAALGENETAAGLSTAGMIADGLITEPLAIHSGRLDVPDRSGLGLTLSDRVSAFQRGQA